MKNPQKQSALLRGERFAFLPQGQANQEWLASYSFRKLTRASTPSLGMAL